MSAIAHVVEGRARDIGGFEVRRVLPWAGGRMVGPFIFLDQMGPAQFPPGSGIDVRPHPHIGLATVTYLFDGEILHRDSLGVVQTIRPGDMNWMTAGRGIVHSERTGPELRAKGHRLYGLQCWVALPEQHEEVAPSFRHFPAGELPVVETGGAKIRVIAGRLFGAASPVPLLSDLFYADVTLPAGAALDLTPDYPERGIYVVEGRLELEQQGFEAGTLVILSAGATANIVARADSRIALLGGAAVGKRHIWWNFVSSSEQRMEAARQDWKAGRFAAVPGETEFIPLPER